MANFCEHCGRTLKEGEVCHCRDGKIGIKDVIEFGGALKGVTYEIGSTRYTDMVKKQVRFVVIVVTIAAFLVSAWLGDVFGGDSTIWIVLFGTLLGYEIAKLMVSKLGMLMEISYNTNEVRKMLVKLLEKDKTE